MDAISLLRCVLVIACALGIGPSTASAQSIAPANGQEPDNGEQLRFIIQYVITKIPTGTHAQHVNWLGRQTDSVMPMDFAQNTDGGN